MFSLGSWPVALRHNRVTAGGTSDLGGPPQNGVARECEQASHLIARSTSLDTMESNPRGNEATLPSGLPPFTDEDPSRSTFKSLSVSLPMPPLRALHQPLLFGCPSFSGSPTSADITGMDPPVPLIKAVPEALPGQAKPSHLTLVFIHRFHLKLRNDDLCSTP